METIGERLGEERKRIGLTQSEFAEKQGVTVQSQGNYERDVREPSAGYLQAAAQMGIDVTYVITGQRMGTPSKPLSPQAQAFLSLYESASQPIQATVMGILATGVVPSGNTVTVSGSNSQAAGRDLK